MVNVMQCETDLNENILFFSDLVETVLLLIT